MSEQRLYQKKHGLPGLPVTAGVDGADGTVGNNVYFGYVYDFFDYTEIEIDNLARVAQSSLYGSHYYTGLYDYVENRPDGVYAVRDELDPAANPATAGISAPTTNVFSRIGDANILAPDGSIYGFHDYFNMSFTDVSSNKSHSYMKVDTGRSGMDPDSTPDPWNTTNADREQVYESSWYGIPAAFRYPYDDASVLLEDSEARIMPGRNTIPKSTGFDLFSVISNGQSYTFAGDNDRYDGLYSRFVYDGQDTSTGNPSIGQILNWTTDTSTGPVDYLKYAAATKEKVIVPDRLSSRIKAGDVLYFYTNKELFEREEQIEYMVVVTEDIEQCTLDRLVDAAILVYPFTFKYSDQRIINNKKYVYTTNKAVSGFYGLDSDVTDSSLYVSAYGRNFTNMLSYMSGASFNMGNMQERYPDSQTTDSSVQNDMLRFVWQDTATAGESDLVITARHSDEPDHNVVRFEAGRLCIPKAVVRQWNVGNVESLAVAAPAYVRLDSAGYAYTLTKDDFDTGTNMFVLTPEKYLRDTSWEDYRCGLDVVQYDRRAGHYDETEGSFGYDAIIKKYVFGAGDDKRLTLDTARFGKTTAYDIVFWIADANGIRRYGRHTRAEYDAQESVFAVRVMPLAGDGTDTIDYDYDEQAVRYVDFRTSGISVDRSSNAFIHIRVPEGAENVTIYMNSDQVKPNPEMIVSNGWCKARYAGMDGDRWYKISLDIASNIPTVNGRTVPVTTAKDFNRWSGSKSSATGCEVFDSLLNGDAITSVARKVTFSVEFDLGDRHISESTDVVQSGYADNRRIPQVSLTMRKDPDRIEQANRLRNGVTANQFQFFIDIDISDFDQTVWGSYSDDEDITLNIDIKSCDADYEMIRKYIIQQARKTSTLHINNVSASDLDDNYFRIRTSVVGTEIANPESVSQKMLDESSEHTINELNDRRDSTLDEDTYTSEITDTVTQGCSTIAFPTIDNADGYYAIGSNSVVSLFADTDDREAGLNDSIAVSLRNIRFSDLAGGGKFRVRVLTEFGNPLFAKLFFRFYVSQIWVHYKYAGGSSDFYVGTENLARKVSTGNLETFEYMFATETLNAFVCPVSLLAIPTEDRMPKAAMDDVVRNDDDACQVTTAISRYVPEDVNARTELLPREERNALYINQKMGWFDFLVSRKYFQDNVRDIAVRPVSLKTVAGVISGQEVFFHSGRTIDDVLSRRDDTGYLALLYDSRFYQRRKHLDTYMFTYGGTEFEASRYSQVYDRTPVFTYQEAVQTLRDDKLYNSIRTWNRVFFEQGKTYDGLFAGHVAAYGNGYMFLKGDYNYDAHAVYSAAETKEMNDTIVPKDNRTGDSRPVFPTMQQPDTELRSQPRRNNWFRRLLYQAEWWYPQYVIDDVTNQETVKPWRLVPGGEYLKNPAGGEAAIPYNLLYGISPRCAQNYDTGTLIVFMLRCPNIGDENHRYQTGYEDFALDVTPDSYRRVFFETANVAR